MAIKLSSILIYIFIIGLLVVLTAGEDIAIEDLEGTNLMFLKVSQIISSILIFIVPALVFVFVLTSDKLRYFQLYSVPKIPTILLSILLMLAVLPIIEVNGSMVFPDFLKGVEQWMRTAEANAEILTEKFLEMDSVFDLLLNLFRSG